MSRLVREAIEAGALGFSTSRTIAHQAMDGEPVPGTFAAEDEVFGLGRAMAAGGQAVFELAPQGAAGEDIVAPKKELEWMQRLGAEIEQPLWFASSRSTPTPTCGASSSIFRGRHAAGSQLSAQTPQRPFGMLFGFPGHHELHPPAGVPQAQGPVQPARRWRTRLAEPAVKAAILSEDDLPSDPTLLFDGMFTIVRAFTWPDLSP